MGNEERDFTVGVREVHVQYVRVKARNGGEAVRKVKEGEGDYLDDQIEYSHTQHSSKWDVKETE